MNTTATWWRRVFLFFTFLGCSSVTSISYAQDRVANYIVTTFSGSLANLSAIAPAISGDDASVSFAMPFNFNYDDATIASGATVRAGTNGWISFGSNPTNQVYSGLLNNTGQPNVIVPFHRDLNVYGGMRLGIAGVSPNRILIIEWDSVRRYGLTTGAAARFQVWLYESASPTGNIIEYRYREAFDWGSTGDIGLNGRSSPSFSCKVYVQGTQYSPSVQIRFTPPLKPLHQLALSPEAINFGQFLAGQTSPTYDITVANVGTNTNLVVNSATINGPADFQIISSPASNVYPPGASGTYKIRFSPLASGARAGSFVVNSNGVDSGSQSISLTGFGIAPAVEFVVENTIMRKTRTRLGSQLHHSFIIKSTGNGPLTINSISVAGEYASMYAVTRMPMTQIPSGTHDTVTVTYTPSEEGLRTATLQLRTNALVGPNKDVVMYGTGILSRLAIAPSVVQFDSVSMGDTAYATVRLSNVGTDTLALKSNYLTFADPDFTYTGIEGADSLIAPERFRDVQVRFIPQTRGHREARIRLLTNIPMTFEPVRRDTSEFIINISGVAVPYGLLSIEAPEALDSVVLGTELCRTVMLTNNGESPLTINSATITGSDADDFEIDGAFPMTLGPSATQQVQICATPSERGLRTAMITVDASSGDRSSTTELPLAIFGLAVCGEPDMTTAFTSDIVRVSTTKQQIVTITNCGDVATTYNAVVAGAGYSLVGNASSGPVAPNATTTFTVAFAPTQRVLYPGTLTVSAEGLTPIVVDLAGTGGNSVLNAAGTSAQATALGEKSQFTVTVTNTGNMDWTVGTPNVPASEFTLLNHDATIASNGGTGEFTFEFEPRLGSQRQAMITFPSSDNTSFSFQVNGSLSSVRATAMKGYVLGQNYPNPIVGSSTISFTMAEAGHAKIIVSDLSGNVVAVLADGLYGAGANEVKFNLSNLTSGSYFYELETNGVRLQRSMILRK